MSEKISRNLSYVFSAAIGLLNFIFLALPHLSAFSVLKFSGYNLLESSGNFVATMVCIITILILLLGIALLVWGVCGLLKAFDYFPSFPSKVGEYESTKIAQLGLILYTGLYVLLLIFLIIECTSVIGVTLGIGIFVALILSGAALVALSILNMIMPASSMDEDVSYVCSDCGKKVKSTDRFCSNCGGQIVKKVNVKKTFACTKCGKPATEGQKFCTSCGGQIAEIVKKERVCSKCGKPASANQKFCTSCGGQIITR